MQGRRWPRAAARTAALGTLRAELADLGNLEATPGNLQRQQVAQQHSLAEVRGSQQALLSVTACDSEAWPAHKPREWYPIACKLDCVPAKPRGNELLYRV